MPALGAELPLDRVGRSGRFPPIVLENSADALRPSMDCRAADLRSTSGSGLPTASFSRRADHRTTATHASHHAVASHGQAQNPCQARWYAKMALILLANSPERGAEGDPCSPPSMSACSPQLRSTAPNGGAPATEPIRRQYLALLCIPVSG